MPTAVAAQGRVCVYTVGKETLKLNEIGLGETFLLSREGNRGEDSMCARGI